MINLGYSFEQQWLFHFLSKEPHSVRYTVHMLDINMNLLQDVTSRFVDGTVDGDANADITRSAKVTLIDPDHSLGLDARNGALGVNYYGKMLRIYRTISSLDSQNPMEFTHPVFTGPISDVSRTGVILDVDCLGKESLAKNGLIWGGPVGGPGHSKHNLIRGALEIFAAERNIDYDADPGYTMGDSMVLEQGEDLWARLREMAYSIGMDLFYNSWGYARLRHRSYSPVFYFDHTFTTSKVLTAFDMNSIKNFVHVTGAEAYGTGQNWIYQVAAPPSHIFSAESLGKGGNPRYLPLYIKDDSLTSSAEVQHLAERTLIDLLTQGVELNFASVILPHLEENDLYGVNTPEYSGNARFTKWSLPLVGDGTMSVGFHSTSSMGAGWELRNAISQNNTRVLIDLNYNMRFEEDERARHKDEKERVKELAKQAAKQAKTREIIVTGKKNKKSKKKRKSTSYVQGVN